MNVEVKFCLCGLWALAVCSTFMYIIRYLGRLWLYDYNMYTNIPVFVGIHRNPLAFNMDQSMLTNSMPNSLRIIQKYAVHK